MVIKEHKLNEHLESGIVNVYKKDCTLCNRFSTDSISYPSGKCRFHGDITGLGKTCDDFKHNSNSDNSTSMSLSIKSHTLSLIISDGKCDLVVFSTGRSQYINEMSIDDLSNLQFLIECALIKLKQS